MKKLVALGGILIAVSSMPLSAQSIVPNPRPGTVLWKQSVDELDPYTAPVLDADGVLWGTRPWPPYQPKGFNTRTVRPIASTLPLFSFPELRLRSQGAFLLDGTAITFEGDGYRGTINAQGSHPWVSTNLSRHQPGVATAQGNYVFAYAPSTSGGTVITQERLAAMSGKDGEFLFDRQINVPPPDVFYQPIGFGPGGRLLTIRQQGERFALSAFDSATGERVTDLILPETIRPLYLQTIRHRLNNFAVTTDAGLVVIAAFRYPPGQNGPKESGVWIVDPARPSENRFVKLGNDYPNVTGLVAARNGLVYASIFEGVPGTPLKLGGVRGIDPVSGAVVVIPDISQGVPGPPVISPDGTLYVLTESVEYPNGLGGTIYAIATGSKGGLARSPWPRSTGDNMNSFREQGVEDSDGDGLTDEEEVSTYRTDPRLIDTDGDGYSDGVEVQNSSDPLNKSNIPEILEAQVAIKLSFGTNVGQRYRLQSSNDLLSWINDGEPFDGTGNRSTRLVEASRARFYWRLVKIAE